VLGAFRYQKNRAVPHRDQSPMPRRRRCWASWVYTPDGDFFHPKITVTYWMNRLPGIDDRHPVRQPQSQARHPKSAGFRFLRIRSSDHGAIALQAHMAALQGRHGIWFAGPSGRWLP
jgi:predicted NAD/FAD-binding protein